MGAVVKLDKRNDKRVCCFTGHRKLTRYEIENLTKLLDGTGGGLGFDSLAAQAVLRARERSPCVKLIMVLPYRNHDGFRDECDKRVHQEILSVTDTIVCLSEHYYDGCEKKRNLHLVQHSSICIACMKDEKIGRRS